MESKLYLFGASGHCKVVIDILQSNNDKISFIIDDNPKKNELLAVPVINSNDFSFVGQQRFIISIGDNIIRKKIAERLKKDFHIAMHPTAIISDYVSIGEGTVVMAASVVNPDVVIGKHCIINTVATIDHDCVIDDFVHISPNASLAGGVEVGEGTHIGIGATVIQGIKIGKWVTIGAGAVIINNVPDYAVVVGNPGRIIKFNKNND